jgi:hypothetical protein
MGSEEAFELRLLYNIIIHHGITLTLASFSTSKHPINYPYTYQSQYAARPPLSPSPLSAPSPASASQ